jgi:hypothetical protein
VLANEVSRVGHIASLRHHGQGMSAVTVGVAVEIGHRLSSVTWLGGRFMLVVGLLGRGRVAVLLRGLRKVSLVSRAILFGLLLVHEVHIVADRHANQLGLVLGSIVEPVPGVSLRGVFGGGLVDRLLRRGPDSVKLGSLLGRGSVVHDRSRGHVSSVLGQVCLRRGVAGGVLHSNSAISVLNMAREILLLFDKLHRLGHPLVWSLRGRVPLRLLLEHLLSW